MRDMVIENGELKKYKGTDTVLTVPEGLTSIGIGAFENRKSLREVFLPSTVTLIEDQPFSGCNVLNKINVAKGNKLFRSMDGILFSRDIKTLLRYPPARRYREYAVPHGVQTIADGAFEDCSRVYEISLPDSLIKIGDEAFKWCLSLRKINIPGNIKEIPYFAFSDCAELSYINLPNGLLKIAEGAFSGTGFRSIRIPDSVTEVEFDAFADCFALKELLTGPHTAVDRHAAFIYGDD